MPGFNAIQCVQGTLGAYFLGSRIAPQVGAGAAAASVLTNPSCGLQGNGPGTYISTSTAPDGTVTTWTNHVGNPGDNSWTSVSNQNPDGSGSSTTWNSDGTSSSTYTPSSSRNIGPVSYDDNSLGGDLAATDDSSGADAASDGGGGGDDEYLLC